MRTVIFHHGDLDGYASVWAYCKITCTPRTDIIAIPVNYGDTDWKNYDMESLKNKKVFMFDFSVSKEVISEIEKVAESFLLIDHHQSAVELLGGLPNCHIDTNFCGAVNVWRYYSKTEIPPFLQYVQKLDLWQFTNRQEEYICMGLSQIDLRYDAINEIAENFYKFSYQQDTIAKYLAKIGEMKYSNVHRRAKNTLRNGPAFYLASTGSISFKKYHEDDIPMFNIRDILWASSALFKYSDYNQVGSFIMKNDIVLFSLRGIEGHEVLPIAKKMNGGGHPMACGFEMSISEFIISVNEACREY